MHRTFVVSRLQFRPASTNESPTVVEKLGFSVLQLMSVSGHDAATGVRADLDIQDPSALELLDSHQSHRIRLEWTFHFGGGAQSISVPLRWTKFHRPSGTVQVVRNVVMRDLIAEAEGATESTPQKNPSASPQKTPSARGLPAKAPSDSATPPARAAGFDAERLWPNVLGGKVMVRPRYQKGSDDVLADLRRQRD